MLQINSGLHHLFGWPVNQTVQIALIAATCGLATLSVASGLDRGIRILSELNLSLAVILLLFVLVLGPTVFLLQTYVQNTGAYLSRHRQQDLQPVRLRAHRLDRRLDPAVLGLVAVLVALRRPVHRPYLARPHDPRVRLRRAVRPGRLHPAVDDGVRRYRHPHGPAGGLHPVGQSGQPGQFGGAVRLPRALPAGQRDFAWWRC